MTGIPARWKRRTLLFFTSQCITLFGSQSVQMAIVWYVTLQTDSGAWIAAFSLCSYLPQFFISFWGGVWADRFNRKRLIIGADVLIAAVTLLMLLLIPHIPSDGGLLWALLLVSTLRSAGAGVQTPAVSAAVSQLVPAEHRMRCNGIYAAMQAMVQFAAPAAAAVMLTAAALRPAMLLDVLTAMLGCGILACLSLPRSEAVHSTHPLWMDMLAGARYACSCAAIRGILAVYALFIFLTVPAGYLSGLLVRRIFGCTYWHLTAVELAGFGGMLAGGLLMSMQKVGRNHHRTLVAGLVLFGAMASCMGFSRRFVPYLVLMALYGVALTAVQTTLTTMLQNCTDARMQGRVFGLMSSLYSVCYPLGMAIFGPLADLVPLQGIMVASGAALLGLAWAVLCSPRLRNAEPDFFGN